MAPKLGMVLYIVNDWFPGKIFIATGWSSGVDVW